MHDSLASLTSKLGRDLLPLEYGGKVPLVEGVERWLGELQEARETVMQLDSMVVTSGSSDWA